MEQGNFMNTVAIESEDVITLTTEWVNKEIANVGQPIDNILIFGTNHEKIQKFKDKTNIIFVTSGNSYEKKDIHNYVINESKKDDYLLLIKSLNEDNIIPTKILHMWSCESRNSETLDSELKKSIYSMLFLSQALMAQKIKNKTDIIYVYLSNGINKPHYSGISGFAKTLYMENFKFKCKVIEIDNINRVDDIILKEFQADEAVDIRYKGNSRFVKIIKEYHMKKPEKCVIKPRGTYIITGGLGGLGLIFARYFSKFNPNLVLSGRSDLDANSQKKISELEALGCKVVYIKADVAKREDVSRMIEIAKSNFDHIDGVVHCAGVIKDAFVIKKTKEEIDAVLAPKVYGTYHLHEKLKNENIDFFVLFSSTAGLVGNMGQCDYSYANSFMDNFSELNISNYKKILSINWPLWKDGGMNVDDEYKKFMEQVIGMKLLYTDVGLSVFECGLSQSCSQLAVIQGNVNKIKERLKIKY